MTHDHPISVGQAREARRWSGRSNGRPRPLPTTMSQPRANRITQMRASVPPHRPARARRPQGDAHLRPVLGRRRGPDGPRAGARRRGRQTASRSTSSPPGDSTRKTLPPFGLGARPRSPVLGEHGRRPVPRSSGVGLGVRHFAAYDRQVVGPTIAGDGARGQGLARPLHPSSALANVERGRVHRRSGPLPQQLVTRSCSIPS
jgi:hypothetical protein